MYLSVQGKEGAARRPRETRKTQKHTLLTLREGDGGGAEESRESEERRRLPADGAVEPYLEAADGGPAAGWRGRGELAVGWDRVWAEGQREQEAERAERASLGRA